MRVVGALLTAALLGLVPGAPAGETTQIRYVMGTLWTIEAKGPAVERAVERAFDEVRRLDALWSTYKPDSELSRVNRKAGAGWVQVSVETFAMLERALGYAKRSAGAFDPTVGPLIEAWGFKHLDYRVPESPVLESARARIGYGRVELDAARGVRFSRPGMSLDLGAIAKGTAVDRALERLRREGIVGGRVDAGGNQGVFGRPEQGDVWLFGVKHPREEEGVLGVVGLTQGAVSTSGDAERGFWKDGVRYGHILDPRTGQPASGVLSVTVVAPTAEAADAWSTALYVLGREAGLAFLAREHPDARALYVEPGGAPGQFRVSVPAGLHWVPAPSLESI